MPVQNGRSDPAAAAKGTPGGHVGAAGLLARSMRNARPEVTSNDSRRLPTIVPALPVGERFGPLAPIAVFGVVGGLVILLALLVVETRTATHQRTERAARGAGGSAETTTTASPVRPAA